MTDLQPNRVLCVAAHADDNEFCYGGTIAKWAANGASVMYLICSDGSKGSADRSKSTREIVETRNKEQKEAAQRLYVESVQHLSYADGTLTPNDDLKRHIVRAIRLYRPDVVMTMDPTFTYATKYNYVNHADHRAVGLATLDAVYPMARDHSYFPELLESGIEPHKTPTLLMSNFDKQPNHIEDISDWFDQKMKALEAHESQMSGLPEVRKFLEEICQDYGKPHKFTLAEGFTRINLN